MIVASFLWGPFTELFSLFSFPFLMRMRAGTMSGVAPGKADPRHVSEIRLCWK